MHVSTETDVCSRDMTCCCAQEVAIHQCHISYTICTNKGHWSRLTLWGSSTICCCWCRVWLLVLLLWVSRVLSSSICRGIIRRPSILSSCRVGWICIGASRCTRSRVWVSLLLGRHCLLHVWIDRLSFELVNGSINRGEHLQRQRPIHVQLVQVMMTFSLPCLPLWIQVCDVAVQLRLPATGCACMAHCTTQHVRVKEG